MSTKVMSKMSFIILKTFRDIFYHAKMSLYLILLYSESKRFLKSSRCFQISCQEVKNRPAQNTFTISFLQMSKLIEFCFWFQS